MPEEIRVKAPWKNQLGEIPFHLDYFEGTMYEGVKKCAERFPDYVALDFMGATITYKKMLAEIDRCARAFKTIGVRKGDKVTIALPNCPQGIYAFYALNLIGAISNMVHPLSAEKELEFYINASNSQTVITLDQFYSKIDATQSPEDSKGCARHHVERFHEYEQGVLLEVCRAYGCR